jgi:uncharacterized membrane protein
VTITRSTVARRLWPLCLLAVLAAAAFLLLAPASKAQAKDWNVNALNADIKVQQNGDAVVDEKVTFNFSGNYHYVSQVIPLDHTDGMVDIAVYDQNGSPLSQGDGQGQYSVGDDGSNKVITLNFDLTDTAATWTFHYRFKNIVQFYDAEDEFFWYVFDNTTPVGIGSVKATVTLPATVASDKLKSATSTDGYEATTNSPEPSTMVYEAKDVPAYSAFGIVLGFPKGVVKYVWTARRIAAFVVPKVALILPVLFFLGMLLIWLKRGRDAPGQTYASYVSEPPSSLSPALAGALIDEKVDTKEVIATIVDLARRGYIEMTDTKEHSTFSRGDTVFTRTKSVDDLTGFEKSVADSLFDGTHPDQVSTKDLRNHFYTHVQPIVGQIYEGVVAAKLFFASPNKVRSRWIGYGFLTAVILGIISFILAKFDVAGWGYFVFGSIVSVVIIWCFSPFMPQRTPAGAQEVRKWHAFRNYLHDLTRFQDMESAKDNFDKYLAYAIAFGVEKEWARRFEGLSVPSPGWYHPPIFIPVNMGGPVGTGTLGTGGLGAPHLPGSGFNLDSISDGLFSSLNHISNTLTSAPSSSGSGHGAFGGGGGGSFGGGFSGGFSGGGGGGFRAG